MIRNLLTRRLWRRISRGVHEVNWIAPLERFRPGWNIPGEVVVLPWQSKEIFDDDGRRIGLTS